MRMHVSALDIFVVVVCRLQKKLIGNKIVSRMNTKCDVIKEGIESERY